jgi:hypothetical protein
MFKTSITLSYRSCTLWIVVVSMNRKYGKSNVEVLVFIVDRRKAVAGHDADSSVGNDVDGDGTIAEAVLA